MGIKSPTQGKRSCHLEISCDCRRVGGRNRDLTDAQNERLREIARGLLARVGGGPYNQTQLAELIGVRQPHLSNFVRDPPRVGISLVSAIKLLRVAGVDQSEVLGDLLGDDSDDASRYPNLTLAIEHMRALWSEDTVTALQSFAMRRDDDATMLEWITQGNRIEAGELDGDLLDEDDTPPADRS